jgi:hypothetical protein
MSAEPGGNPSRHSNGSYPALDVSGPKQPDSQNADQPEGRPDVPTVEERIRGLLERWPERCMVPVSEEHGTKLRREAVEEPETVEETVQVGEHEEITTYETVEQSAQPHIAVVEELLQMYERYRDLHLKLEKREHNEEPEEFLIGLENSYSPEYQSKHYARLSAWERQILGGEYPHGGEVEGAFKEPVTVLMGLTASAYREAGNPASGLRPICDHDRENRDAWTGSSDSVKRTLRYVLEDSLGLPSDAYTWWWQSEPHGGGGANTDRSHSHPIVVLDASAADVSADAISPETFRPVLAKHISLVNGATWDAHEVEETVEVRTEEEVNSLAGYVAKYVACDPEKDLLERSDEYLMWAASQWATATQKYSRDRVCTAATKADACHQEYVSEESNQSVDHGETVVRSKKPGVSFECAACGSSFGIDQSGTLTEHRTAQTASGGVCAADGGAVVEEASETADGLSDGLRSAWRDARAAARIESPVEERDGERTVEGNTLSGTPVEGGESYSYCTACGGREPSGECDASAYKSADYSFRCPLPSEHFGEHTVVYRSGGGETRSGVPDAYRGNGHVQFEYDSEPSGEYDSASFRRPATWEPVSVVRTWSGEEESVGAPSGVEYREVVVEGAGAAVEKMPIDHLPPVRWLEGPEPWERYPVEEPAVRSGELPPPEILAKEHAEHTHGRRITPKEWPDDWYARRFEEEPEESGGLSESERREVIQLVENESVSSAVEVVGRLQFPPDATEEVRVLVE